MINVVYLVLVMTIGGSGVTSESIPQANMKQCLVNKSAYDSKRGEPSNGGSNIIYYRATCIVGVK